MLSDLEQRALMDQARRGSAVERRHALDELLRDFRGAARAAIHRTLAGPGARHDAAEDILQVAILKFMTAGVGQYRGEASPRTYFVRIAKRCALDERRRGVRLAYVTNLPDSPVPPASLGPTVDELTQTLRDCLLDLRHIYREAVSLYYFEKHGDCAACADKVGVRRNTFEQRLSRGRQALAASVHSRLARLPWPRRAVPGVELGPRSGTSAGQKRVLGHRSRSEAAATAQASRFRVETRFGTRSISEASATERAS